MERKQHIHLERNYLIASAAAIFTAFLCINLYPDYHGGPQIGRSGLLALSAAMIAMMIYIVHKALTDKKNSEEQKNEEPVSDPARLKKMFFLWSGFTVLLSASLVRYPIYFYIKENQPFDTQGIVSLVLGVVLTIGTVLHVAIRVKQYRKL
ncbi:MAG: hypothetical protein JXX29_04955 [Deltaproteobacteria bacterium]|nr:hypothetical protein [Deltaproteobacteria bacterium]MBN2670995.1 hypothetical protein [Deltaproteobacteria bacterium]